MHSSNGYEHAKDRKRKKHRISTGLLFRSGNVEFVAFAVDLIIATRGGSVKAVENYANVELCKINDWMKNNKARFNDKKSKAMLVSRRKEKKTKIQQYT